MFDANHGFVSISKPEGLSSFQVVRKVRSISKVKKVGHAGTLDPFATGVLILALGRNFTRYIDRFQALPKAYEGVMALGYETDTLDSYGTISKVSKYEESEKTLSEKIEDVLPNFQGSIMQMPPQFSAKKVNGKRAYKAARKGEIIKLEPRLVEIHNFTVHKIIMGSVPMIHFSVRCSKGTYVRSLVRDFAEALGTVAYTKDLARTAIGPFSIEMALTYEELTEENLSRSLFYEKPSEEVVK